MQKREQEENLHKNSQSNNENFKKRYLVLASLVAVKSEETDVALEKQNRKRQRARGRLASRVKDKRVELEKGRERKQEGKKIGTGWQREGGRAFPRHP